MAGAGTQAGQALTERLGARRPEIEEAVLTRVYSVQDPTEAGDPAYVAGLRAAVGAAIDYGLANVQGRPGRPGPIPLELFAQARQAARNGVSLDTVLRRYFAGYTLLGDFVMQEAEGGGRLRGARLQQMMRSQAVLFDRLVAAVTDEYTHEAQGQFDSQGRRRAECVERLLAGELIDTAELGYEIDAWHIGAIAAGPGAERAIQDLAKALDRRLLALRRGGGAIWAWLGGARRLSCEEIERPSAPPWPAQVSMAIGEPARGLSGWRLTHQQAGAAWPIALRSPQALTRYADVSLLASMLRDEVLTRSLNELYLLPLMEERNGGATLLETLRAYFAAECNASSAAAALEVNRQTVTNRLRAIEDRLGRSLSLCSAEVQAALRLQEFDDVSPETAFLDELSRRRTSPRPRTLPSFTVAN